MGLDIRPLNRRRLLTGAAAAGATAACTTSENTGPPSSGPGSWADVRAQFDLKPGIAHMAAFVLAAHPAPVRAAVVRHRRGMDADAEGYLLQNQERLERAVRNAAATHIGAPHSQIALTDSTTMGLGLLYGGLQLSAGDEVLTTEHDFYATHEALRLRAARDGVNIVRARLYDDPATADAEQMVRRLTARVTAKTRIAAVTWVHSGTGVKLPITAMAEAIADLNSARPAGTKVLLCVDGVHGFGVARTPVSKLGCDFLVSGCHKWLFGPRGTGLVWGSPAAWKRLDPIIPTFTPQGGPGPKSTPGGYHSFEHRWALAEAFQLHRRIGPARIEARVTELAGALKDGLRGIRGVTVITPRSPEVSAGIVCCEVAGQDPPSLVAALAARKVSASATPYETSYLRFGPSIATEEHDVEATLAAMRAVV